MFNSPDIRYILSKVFSKEANNIPYISGMTQQTEVIQIKHDQTQKKDRKYYF